MTPKPVHQFYETAGHREYCLSFGADNAERTILIIPPLFEEMNRTRCMIVEAMRQLPARGIRTYLMDLPGCNESLIPLSLQSLTSWHLAVADAASHLGATHIAAIRGGCLLDHVVAVPRWRLAPVQGATLLKTLLRSRVAGDKEVGVHTTAGQLLADGCTEGLNLAGHRLSPQMLSELETAIPIVTRLVTEAQLDDVAGSLLWLRTEPGENKEMSAAFAARLDIWSATCAR